MIVVVMALGLIPGSASAAFTDDADINATFSEAVNLMTALGIINGYPEGNFDPQGVLTRAHAARFFAYVLLTPATAKMLPSVGGIFDDVDASHWASGDIAFCADQKIINGYGGTRNFGPDDPVTLSMFAVMWMRALGVTPDRWTGDLWEFNAITDGMQQGLFAGLGDVDLTAQATREQAAQSVYNALFWGITTVETGTYKIVVNPTATKPAKPELIAAASMVFGSWYEAFMVAKTVQDDAVFLDTYNITEGTKSVGGIAGDIFKLTRSDGTDAFGRPVVNYTQTGKTAPILTLASGLLFEYNVATTGAKVYGDLGLTAATTASLYIDGIPATATSLASDANANILGSGQGSLLQVYPAAGGGYRIVATNYYIGTISVSDADATKGTIARVSSTETFNTNTSAFAKDSYVMYTLAGGSVASITLAKIEDEVGISTTLGVVNSATAGANVGTLTADGVPYKFNANGVSTSDVKASSSAKFTFYLDGNDNILYSKLVKAPDVVPTYLYLHKIAVEAGSSVLFGDPAADKFYAQVTFEDGTPGVIQTKAKMGTGTGISGDPFVPDSGLYSYSISDGIYTLTEVQLAASNPAISKGNPVIGTYYADSGTRFLVGTDVTKAFTSYTGFASVPSFALAAGDWAYLLSGTKIVLAFMVATPTTDPVTPVLTLVVGRGALEGGDATLGEYRKYNAFSAGAPIDNAFTAAGANILPTTDYFYGEVGRDSKGLIDTDLIGTGVGTITALPQSDGDYAGASVLNLKGSVTGFKAVTGTTQVWIIAAGGAISAGELTDIKGDNYLLIDYAEASAPFYTATRIFVFK